MGVLSLVVFAIVGTALTTYMRDHLERRLGEQMKLVQVTQSKDAAAHGSTASTASTRPAAATAAAAARASRSRAPWSWPTTAPST
jgi:hypothetical protein